MKKYSIIALCLLLFVSLLAPACSQKSGCPATESLKAPVNRKGEIKKKKGGSSGLFPKKMNKKMK
ncbi:MAG: hypothetical protein IT259_12490 [Saprospiraceae bacterium]|nr:hypothetical protein [Saprospiraceae bacterium]